MCRLALYSGTPEPLSALLYDPPHSLERQAYVPRELISGHVNVDGTGVAWWVDDKEPLRYVAERPPWSDPNLPTLARRLVGAPILAAVRSQTPGMPAGVEAAHPFTFGRWAGAHNGYLGGFLQTRWSLIDRLDDETRGQLDVVTDSLVLFLLAVTLRRRGASLAVAVLDAATTAARLSRDLGEVASINLVVVEREEAVALRFARGVEPNTLYTLANGRRWSAGALVASEPLDGDPDWTLVPPDHLVRVAGAEISLERIRA